jgi:hypothetical protein
VKTRFAAAATLALLFAFAPSVDAHHSFAAEFDGNKTVRLVGKLNKIEWTNPHAYFYLDVEDQSGKVSNWGCEAGAPGALSGAGSRKAILSWATPWWWTAI